MTKKIADISKWQGVIDWPKAASELAFCILRASCGVAADSKFADNAKGCKGNGIPFHAYHYLMAMDEAQAKTEAEFFYKTASAQGPLFYVVDVEDEHIPTGKARSIVSAFLARIKELGAKRTGIYVAHHRYDAFDLATEEADYVWIPRYGKNTGEPQTPPGFPCDLWQYTSKGALAGVKGNVDLNSINSDKPLSWFVEQKEDNVSNTTNRALVPFTNEHFVAFLEQMVGRPYWYGTCVYKCTNSLLSRKTNQYPSHYKDNRTAAYKKHISAKEVCADCIGAAKGYAWTNGGEGVIEAIGTDESITSKYGSNKCPDKGANSMFAYAKDKGMPWGTIQTIPEIPGLAVTFSGHVGYYAGNGRVIEFKGFSYGAVETKLSAGKWTHWYELPFLDYGEWDDDLAGKQGDSTATAPSANAYTLGSRLLKKGSKGADVTELQKLLVGMGYNLGTYGNNADGIDGSYGSMTEKAVKKFQSIQQIQVDGKYGSITHKALMGVLEDNSKGEDDEEKADTTPEIPSATEVAKHVRVTGNEVNVRTGPATTYKVITRVNSGTTMPYVATAEAVQWHAVEINGKIGWISGKYSEVKEG